MFKLLHGTASTITRILSPPTNFVLIGLPSNKTLCRYQDKHLLLNLKSIRYKSKFRTLLQDLLVTMSSVTKATNAPNSEGNGNEDSPNETLTTEKEQCNRVQRNKDEKEFDGEEKLTSRQKRNRNRNRIRRIKKNASNNVENSEETAATERKSNKTPLAKNENSRHIKKNNKVETGSEKLPEYLLSANPDGGGKTLHGNEKKMEKNHYRTKLPEINFQQYITFQQCSEGLKRGELIQGMIRVNARNFHESYITSETGGRDILIDGVAARNRALPGDVVAVKLLPKDKWKRYRQNVECETNADSVEKDSDFSKTGSVVFVIEKKNPRIAAGHLAVYRNNAYGFALMSPIDSRLPRLMIPLNECPDDFKTRPDDFVKTLFIARICNWSLNVAFASGKLMRSLGEAGHIVPETEAMLIANDIDSSPFEKDVVDCLPDGDTWCISEEELAKRKDLRKECIFTVDPATARDLDDALSCKKVGDDLYEVGVHIADVSHFIKQDNALDKVAMQRATSVYLAQKVIPMLPSILCEKLCSLNPAVERLAYSVIWNIKSNGTVLSEWFGRSVIRSCIKLSYNHAQQMIESSKHDLLNPDEYPAVSGGFALEKIRDTIKLLHGISDYLRKKRFESGALKLDQPKLAFTLESKTGLPNGCSVYEYKDSNRMIEEFMLLANMAVGRKIYEAHPERAILRCHPPPHSQMMEDLLAQCNQYNIPFDISDSASISRSLDRLSELDPETQKYMLPALTLLATKPFQNAKYFCTGSIEDESIYRHYALNVPIYTHFTSPIRRYPDVLVHRFLTAALDGQFEVNGEVKELQTIAEHCNDKKWAAKKVSEQSSMLFFAVYLLECGPMLEKGVVVGVLDKAIDVLCTRIGIVSRVYCDKLSLFNREFKMVDGKPQLTLNWIDEAKTKGESVDEKITSLTKRFERNWAQQRNQAQNDIDKVEELTPVPDDAIPQTISMFSPVDIILRVERQAPTKIIAYLQSPFITDTPDLGL